jgi:hypothetical protein
VWLPVWGKESGNQHRRVGSLSYPIQFELQSNQTGGRNIFLRRDVRAQIVLEFLRGSAASARVSARGLTKITSRGDLIAVNLSTRARVSVAPPLILHPSSFILHPSSFILHPSSLIPHPSSLIPHPSSLRRSLHSQHVVLDCWPSHSSARRPWCSNTTLFVSPAMPSMTDTTAIRLDGLRANVFNART